MDTPLAINLEKVNKDFENATALDILTWCYDTFTPDRVKQSTSFGAEGMVILHMLVNLVKTPRVFTLDTGRLFQETYNVWQEVVDKYGITIEAFSPDKDAVHEMVTGHGPNLFYHSVENRKRCCYIRKVVPLRKALSDADAWITGLRRDQSDERKDMPYVSFNHEHNVYKICPLLDWTEYAVWEYIRNNNVPYDKLHDQGYRTIGCQPCTRPVRPAEDIRGGRWWWEQKDTKECGIHIDGDTVKRKKPPSFTI
jgi:thioredoxin-dependent adenylylsulfate APS reductase